VLIREIPGVTGIDDRLKIGVPQINWDGTVT
jgi:hypothetical protein